MSKIKELTAHLRRLIEKNYIVDYGIDNELNTVLNQIDIESELMKDTTTWIQIKCEDDLPKDDKNVLAMIDGEMKIMCLSDIIENGVSSKVWCLVYDSLDGDGIYDDNYYPTHWMPLPTHPQTESTKINYINQK